jgi:hypothetical protein
MLIVKGLAPASKTIPLTSVLADREMSVTLDPANVAVSEGPLGIFRGVQLPAVFQSPLAGLAFHVALPEKLLLAVESRSARMAAAEGRKAQAGKRRSD